ncbi:hypothetical protein [Sphingomonas dokdonensis]|uniref:Uncharacterized protein n=1 Tax=Sphingomonas dokdonensis TaxID=344880 RepID=A0A245ZCW4_9SPHN|nr:hypothetical protein [Sphingomonas dokdonensis]OWK27545.1 hypothetical protein SPDO_32280 [Sphingomonas dokdonensis]
MNMIHVGNSEPSARHTYHRLRERRLCELLGQWVSGIEPLIFERLDVSPHVLAEVGIGAPGADVPMLTAQITVDAMLAELGWPAPAEVAL